MKGINLKDQYYGRYYNIEDIEPDRCTDPLKKTSFTKNERKRENTEADKATMCQRCYSLQDYELQGIIQPFAKHNTSHHPDICHAHASPFSWAQTQSQCFTTVNGDSISCSTKIRCTTLCRKSRPGNGQCK